MQARYATILALLLIIAGPPLAPAANNALTTDTFFDDKVLHEIRITMDLADWETMRANYLDSTYYQMTFQYREIEVSNVGVKLRGTASRNPVKPNLHVKFDKNVSDQTFLGMTEMELKAQVQDASMLKEILSMKLFQRAGIPVPREAQTRLYVNGEYKGVYTMIESVNNDFLDRVYGNHRGYLYKFQNLAEPYNFEDRGTEIADYVPSPFEPQNHKTDPVPATIADMVQAMNYAPDAEFVRTMSRYLEWNEFLSYIAIDNYMAQFDGFLGEGGINNIYLYRLPDSEQIIFIPWDKDYSFFWDSDVFLRFDADVLSRRAMQMPELRAKYLEALVKNGVMLGGDHGWIQSEVTRLSNLIRASVFEDPYRLCNTFQPCTNNDFESTVAGELAFLAARPVIIRQAADQAGFQLSDAGPRIRTENVTNAASGTNQLAPGALVSVYGAALATQTSAASDDPLSCVLAGAEAYVNGYHAPLLYVSPGQINLQLPFSMSAGVESFTIVSAGVLGNSANVELKPAAPGLFLAAHADGIPVSGEEPAVPGEMLAIFGTGLGPVSMDMPDGERTPWAPSVTTTEPVQANIGGVAAEVQSSFLMPGFVALYAVHARVPQSAPTGAAALIVNACGIDSAPIWIDINATPTPVR